MSDYSIVIKKHSPLPNSVLNWCLDFPKDQSKCSVAELLTEGVNFQGWLLTKNAEIAQLFVVYGETRIELPLNRQRPDVIKAVLREDPINHPKLQCGFRLLVPLHQANFQLVLRVNGAEQVLINAEIQGAFKVVQGRHGWLFLDNDTNKSVEQFTGKYLIESDELKGWKTYFKSLSKLTTNLNLPFLMLMAPSKEWVNQQYYPYEKGAVTAIEQLMAIVPANFPLLHPVHELRQLTERSFRVTDTHWSAHGAALAAKLCAERFQVSSLAITELFARDEFYEKDMVGDLGNKVFPPVAHPEAILKHYSYRKSVVYDNQLPNFGRVLIMKNGDAIIKGHLLIFGSSSAYSMLNQLCRIFGCVTLIHSAGNVDSNVVKQLSPDYLLVQTNARFVVRAPSLDYCLVSSIAEKLKLLSFEQRQQQLEEVAQKASQEYPISFLHNLYQQALQKFSKDH